MSLVSVSAYRTFTQDTSTESDAVSAALEESTEAWEDYLDRWLVSAEYTETVNVDKKGRVYPKAYPVTSVASGYTIRGGGTEVIGASPNFPAGFFPTYEDEPSVDLTYTGGFDSVTVPRVIMQNIIKSAHKVLHPDMSSLAGVTSARVGDASVTYAESTGAFDIIDKSQIREMKPYRRRHV